MGRQINYYMEYDSFVLLAKKAVELGCEILPFSVEVLKRGCSLDILSKEELSYCIIEQIINSFQVCKVLK